MYGKMWWLSAALYFVAAALFFRNSRQAGGRPWRALSVFSVVLGANKLLDLTGMLLRQFRKAAWNQGWYGDRAPVQKLFIVAVVVVALLMISVTVVRLKRRRWTVTQRLALMGGIYLLAYSLTRSSSLHRIDAFLYRPTMGIELNWIFELSGLGLLIFAALRGRRRTSRTRCI